MNRIAVFLSLLFLYSCSIEKYKTSQEFRVLGDKTDVRINYTDEDGINVINVAQLPWETNVTLTGKGARYKEWYLSAESTSTGSSLIVIIGSDELSTLNFRGEISSNYTDGDFVYTTYKSTY